MNRPQKKITRIFFNIFIVFFIILLAGSGLRAFARPFAAELFCKAYPESPSCKGTKISCSYCHQVVPPELNSFGQAIKGEYAAAQEIFDNRELVLRDLTKKILSKDSDGDGFTNQAEIDQGSLPGVSSSLPAANGCQSKNTLGANDYYKLCQYDFDYAYKKIWNVVCGEPPSWDEFESFKKLAPDAKPAGLKDQLAKCVDSEHWLGKDGVVWEIGHYKIRPVGSVKSGEDETVIGLVDYYDDYHIFVYSQIDGHDARDVLLADYAVTREKQVDRTIYTRQEPVRLDDGIVMQPEYRAGLLTSFWTLGFYLNYTAVARVLVAQAFNGFLGISLATLQGLEAVDPAESRFEDYDNKGVTQPQCAECHRTIDPMTYPFRNYNGLTGSTQVLAGKNAEGLKNIKRLGDRSNLTPLSYSTTRMEYLKSKYPNIDQMPEEGYVLGQKVANLREWASVVANSDQFAAQTVKDYWKVLMGHEPLAYERAEFERVWKNLKSVHQFSVEAMLAEMIMTEAFGVP